MRNYLLEEIKRNDLMSENYKNLCRALNDFHCVKSVQIRSFSSPYFSTLWLNTEIYSVNLCIQSEYGKIRTRKYSVFGHLSCSVWAFSFSVSAFIGVVSISAFASLVDVPVGIASSAVVLKICTITAGIKICISIIKKKSKKYDKLNC